VEEQILSQQLTQLSTKDTFNSDDNMDVDIEAVNSTSFNKKRSLSTPSTPDVIFLRRTRSTNATGDDDDDMKNSKDDNIPQYLQQQSANHFFEKILNETTMTTAVTVEDLR
jgi:hypothetical protein